MALTRVPFGLLDKAFPVRWIGTENDRLNPSKAFEANEKNYLFLQKTPSKPSRIFVLTDVVDSNATWEEVGSGEVTLDNSPAIAAALATKLDKDFSGFTNTTPGDNTVLAVSGAEKITLKQINDFVQSQADRLFQGVFATGEELSTEKPSTPENPLQEGSYAIVASTDTIWIWDAQGKQWKDGGATGTVEATRKISTTNESGLTGGGTLAADLSLAVKYGDTQYTACEGNDIRLQKEVKWTGTEAERLALATTGDNPLVATDVNKIFVQTIPGSQEVYLYLLKAISPAVTWTKVKGGTDPLIYKSGTLDAGTSTIKLDKVYPLTDYFIELYIEGVRQMGDGSASSSFWQITDDTINLGGSVSTSVSYDLIIHPKS